MDKDIGDLLAKLEAWLVQKTARSSSYYGWKVVNLKDSLMMFDFKFTVHEKHVL